MQTLKKVSFEIVLEDKATQKKIKRRDKETLTELHIDFKQEEVIERLKAQLQYITALFIKNINKL